MEEQIKVGDYVRTKRGQIGKVEKICEKHIEIEFNRMWKDLILNENIIKSSTNIIDLIEIGDYVNGYLIDYIGNERTFLRSERPYREDSTLYKDLIEKGKNYNQCLHFFEKDIKSIVTKEHFEQIEYRIGE